MLRLRIRQREMLIDKVPDLANLAVASLGFGQLLSAEAFSIPIAFGGLFLWVVGMVFASFIARRDA